MEKSELCKNTLNYSLTVYTNSNVKSKILFSPRSLLIWIYYHIFRFQISSIELIWLFSLEVQTGFKRILSRLAVDCGEWDWLELSWEVVPADWNNKSLFPGNLAIVWNFETIQWELNFSPRHLKLFQFTLQETIIFVFIVKCLRENARILNLLFDLNFEIARLILLCIFSF